ncbi:retroviral-like aspartic protease family protein [Winogradskyella sp.]|nr:retroviral-like aspartic protease family protein [Winogradskyella sp.]
MKIKLHFMLILFFYVNTAFSQVSILMNKKNDVYTIPCKVNGLELDFIFDTGASNVSLSLTEALFMIKNGKLKEEDIIGSSYAQLANGDITENTEIIIKEIEISGLKLYNVRANIVHKLEAPLLLGQSAISQLGKIQLDGNKLTILTKEYYNSELTISLAKKIPIVMPVSCIKMSPDKEFIAVADDTEDPLGFQELKETFKINILNSDNFSKKFELKGHVESIESINFSANSKRIVSSDKSGVIIIWNLSDGKQLAKIETGDWVHNIKFSNSGNEIFAIQGYEKVALIYNINGNLITKLEVGKQINDFEYNPITNKIYFGCYDELQVWSLVSRDKLNSLPFSGLMCMQYNHDYSQLAIGNSNGDIIIMSPELKEIYRLNGHFKPVLSISFSFDNSKLASASSDQTARIWELKKQSEIIQLTNEHNGSVKAIEYISDKNEFITGGENKELKIWK